MKTFKHFNRIKNWDMVTVEQILASWEEYGYDPELRDYSVLPNELKTEETSIEFVKQDGYALQHVENQTEAICLEAVKQNGWALFYVKNQTEAICLEAVKQNGYALEYVKCELRPYVGANRNVENPLSFEEWKVQNDLNSEWNFNHGVKKVTYPSSKEPHHLCMECITYDATQGKVPVQMNPSEETKCFECGKENKKVA